MANECQAVRSSQAPSDAASCTKNLECKITNMATLRMPVQKLLKLSREEQLSEVPSGRSWQSKSSI